MGFVAAVSLFLWLQDSLVIQVPGFERAFLPVLQVVDLIQASRGQSFSYLHELTLRGLQLRCCLDLFVHQ